MSSRREFITLLGSAAAWPSAARAQAPAMPVIGYLTGGGPPNESVWPPFYSGLADFGFTVGRNIAVELRASQGYEDLPSAAAELVRRRVDVITTQGAANAALAAMSATKTIPIVFRTGSDPVKAGLVASMNRPGGNVTGVSYMSGELSAKRLELLREIAPKAAVIGILTNPANLVSQMDLADLLAAAQTMGQPIVVFKASNPDEINAAFASAVQGGIGALLVDTDSFFTRRRQQLVTLAAAYRIATSYNGRAYVEAGGLMSYGDDRSESGRQAARYVGRILKGEKPADLPVLQPTKLEFAINLRAAKALGLTVPNTLLVAADKVIE